MAFFNDLKKTISGTSQNVVNKTKDLTEISKLNSKISDLKKNNDQLYLTLGKLYMEKFGETPHEAFKGAVSSIQENNKQIVEYQEQIKNLKGIRTCPSCGAEIPNGSQFCPKCGTRVEEDKVVADVEAVEEDKVEDKQQKEAAASGTEAEKPAAEEAAAAQPEAEKAAAGDPQAEAPKEEASAAQPAGEGAAPGDDLLNKVTQ